MELAGYVEEAAGLFSETISRDHGVTGEI